MKNRRKKKRSRLFLFLYLIIFILLFVLLYVVYIYNFKFDIETVNDYKTTLDSDVYIENLVKSCNKCSVTNGKDKIKTSKIGNVKVIVKYKTAYNKLKEKTVTVLVYDDIAPIITYKKSLSTFAGKSIDLLESVSVSDNYDQNVDVKVEGTYDFNIVGDYILYYVAVDSSGNSTKEKFTLSVNKSDDNITYFTTSKGFNGYTKDGITYIDGILVVNKSYSLPASYGSGLTKDFNNAFSKMKDAAKKDGISLNIVSGFRSYEKQQATYNGWVNKDGKEKADTYSARAGFSEHQSGLAADLNHVGSNFDNTKEAKWLESNCYKYGFILRYPKGKQSETGYVYESWHFRYVGTDLAKKLYNNGNWLTLEDYFGISSKYN